MDNLSIGISRKMRGDLKGLYVQSYRKFPKDLCTRIDEQLQENSVYTMGCACRMGIYGNITLRFRHSNDQTNRETVEAFVKQADLALQRRHMREKLRKSEERIRVLERDSSMPGRPGTHAATHTNAHSNNSSGGEIL